MALSPPKLMMARLEDKTIHTEKFVQYAFELESPHLMPFVAGQYVSLKVSETGARRSYSICSTPDTNHGFELLIDLAPNGLGCQYLQGLQFGDQIQVLGPMGMFVVEDRPEETALAFVATGSGIAPIRAMVLDQLQVKKDTRPITLYWGLRHEKDMFWQQEFQELSDSFENFTFHPTMSQPETGQWTLCSGRVTDCLNTHDLLPNAGYYICGNERMLHDVLELLKQKGVPEVNLHHEKFY
jgi:NAD(P)H-flavin reductase